MMKKRVIGLLAIFCLLCSICVPAFAQDGTFDYGEDWRGGGIYLENYRGSGGEIVIPSEYDGKKVTAVGYLGGSKAVTKVTVSEGITTLSEAFKDMTALKEVVLPHSLQIVGAFTFQNTGIQTLDFQEGLEVIEIDSINNNPNLKSISIPASNKTIHAAAIWNNPMLQSFFIDAENPYWITTANGMLLMRKDIYEVYSCASGAIPRILNIPEEVQEMHACALTKCTNLEILILPKSIKSISPAIIEECSNLKVVYAKADGFDIDPRTFNHIKGQVTVYCNASPNMEPSDNFTVKPYIEGMEKEVLAVPNSVGNGNSGQKGTSSTKPNTAKSQSEQTTASVSDTTVAELATEPLTQIETETVSATTEPTADLAMQSATESPKYLGWIIGGTVGIVLLAVGAVLVILQKKGKLPSRKPS